LGSGDEAGTKDKGSSEIKLGHLKSLGGSGRDAGRFLATIEPFHGNQVVVYTPPADGKADAKGLWTRTVLDDSFKEGHGIWCADFDGDGNDEVVAGWRGAGQTIRVFTATPGTGGAAPAWHKHDLDVGGVAVEHLIFGDLNGDC